MLLDTFLTRQSSISCGAPWTQPLSSLGFVRGFAIFAQNNQQQVCRCLPQSRFKNKFEYHLSGLMQFLNLEGLKLSFSAVDSSVECVVRYTCCYNTKKQTELPFTSLQLFKRCCSSVRTSP